MKKFISVLMLFVVMFMISGIMPQNTVSALEVLPTTSDVPSPGCTFLGIEGKYITQIEAAIDRINKIRLEACNEGVKDPSTGKPLTPGDYVPLKWSSDLEYIARIRAAEASVTIAHQRTNGESIWFSGPGGVRSNAEVIAWNWSENMTSGIEQWYSEKSDWVNDTDGVTGHYTSMINPRNRYVGLGTFCSSVTRYYNTTVGEFSSTKYDLDTSRGSSTGTVIQTLDVKTDHISYEIVCPDNVHDSDKISVSAAVTFTDSWSDTVKTGGLILPDDTAKNIEWSSSDSSIVYVSNGQIKVRSCGSATISAKIPDGGTVKKSVSVLHEYEVTTTEATCKDEGKIVKKCRICGDTITQTIPKTNKHTYETTTVAATCKDEGKIIKKCRICGDTITQTIPKTNKHTYETTTVAATCKDEGKIIKKCKVCGDTVTQTIPKTDDHTFGGWVVTKEPTANEDGTETRTCTVCGTAETRSVPYDQTETGAPPATTEGGTTETTAEPAPDSSGTQTTETAETPSGTSDQQPSVTDAPVDDTQDAPDGDTQDAQVGDTQTEPSSDKDNPNDDSDTISSSPDGSGGDPSGIWIPIAVAGGGALAAIVVIVFIYIKRRRR